MRKFCNYMAFFFALLELCQPRNGADGCLLPYFTQNRLSEETLNSPPEVLTFTIAHRFFDRDNPTAEIYTVGNTRVSKPSRAMIKPQYMETPQQILCAG